MDARNDYGFPVAAEPQSLSMALLGFDLFAAPMDYPRPVSKWERARQYAAQVRERKKVCSCDRCEKAEKLEAVQNILNNWRTK